MAKVRKDVAVIILAAGQGKRLGGQFPKVLLRAVGQPLVVTLLVTVKKIGFAKTVMVTGHGAKDVEKAVAPYRPRCIRQARRLGTGDAVRVGLKALGGFEGTVVVLCGDAPLVTQATLSRLLESHAERQADLTMMTTRLDDPTGYGRVLRDGGGEVVEIREEVDCAETERTVDEIATGVYAFRADFLREFLPQLGRANRQKEFYLPDLVRLGAAAGRRCDLLTVADSAEFQGVNTWGDLACVRAGLRSRVNMAWMQKGVELVDPGHTWIDATVTMDPPLKILPFTVIEGPSHLGRESVIGPFAHLRPGSQIGTGAHVGNFVEIKKSRLGKGSKANHLSYVGDATIGARVNVGAGTITCNYDGRKKNPTVLGDDVFVGSDTQFVAPVKVGRGAWIGAGTTVTKNVPPYALAVSRCEQKNIAGWGRRRSRPKGK